jgi:hypothetical protein
VRKTCCCGIHTLIEALVLFSSAVEDWRWRLVAAQGQYVGETVIDWSLGADVKLAFVGGYGESRVPLKPEPRFDLLTMSAETTLATTSRISTTMVCSRTHLPGCECTGLQHHHAHLCETAHKPRRLDTPRIRSPTTDSATCRLLQQS